MASQPITIAGKVHASRRQSSGVSASSSSSRGFSVSPGASPMAAGLQRRASQASSKQSVSTRDTSLSDDGSVRAMASPTSSIKSNRPNRPRMMSTSKVNTASTRYDAVDPLAFHRRSTQLFAMSPMSTAQHSRRPSVQRTLTTPEAMRPQTAVLSRTSTQPDAFGQWQSFRETYSQPSAAHSAESLREPAVEPAVTIHWTSDETRRKEYADIDRRCKGLRGLWNKVAPKFARTGTAARFYNEDDGSDAGSVRRFRLDLPSDGKE